MTVFFDKVPKYHRSLVQESIKNAFQEFKVDLSGKKSAFIKVNIVRPAKPNSCVVTHPIVVEALINVLREFGLNQITVGEGSAAGVDTAKAFKKSGFFHLADKMKVRLLDINKSKMIEKEWHYGTLKLPSELLSSDLYINVPKMKTHFHTGVTLSVKNQQGLLTKEAKKANHREHDLFRSLISIAEVVQPHFVIVDAVDSMEGEGPTKGRKKHTGVMVYGDNMFDTDIACCHFMGVPVSKIKYLSLALEENLAKPDPKIEGKAFSDCKSIFEMPSPKPKQIVNFYSWKNYMACAEDEHSFEEAIHLALTTPKYWFTFIPKFAYLVLFKRFDLLRGKNAKVPKDSDCILCVGNCAQNVATESGTYFVPGCPPKPEDIIKTIIKMK